MSLALYPSRVRSNEVLGRTHERQVAVSSYGALFLGCTTSIRARVAYARFNALGKLGLAYSVVNDDDLVLVNATAFQGIRPELLREFTKVFHILRIYLSLVVTHSSKR